MKNKQDSILGRGVLLLLFFGLFAFGCGGDDNPATPAKTEFEVLQPAVDAYTSNTSKAPVISAQSLFDNMNDGNAANDYFVLSVRSATDYANGHITGASNIPWRDIGKAANLALLPTDEPIAVYCYTGHTGGLATALLNAKGFDAYNLKHGMCSWTTNASVLATTPFNDATDAHDFAVETQANTPTVTFDIPATSFTTSEDEDEILRAAVDYVATNISAVITAQTLFDNLNDGNAANNPVIVSVRSADHYALGHVTGAINIFWRDIAKEANLVKLDPSKQIVVYCYTGHTGAVAAAALNLLGYNAVNMKFGMMSWTRDQTVRAASAFNPAVDAHDFPVETGL